MGECDILYGEKQGSIMDIVEMLTIIGSIIIPLFAGFGWMIHRMDSKFEKIDIKLQNIQTDVTDIRERVSFMEGFIFFSEFKSESNNSRSDSAKKMWERRKMKAVESKK